MKDFTIRSHSLSEAVSHHACLHMLACILTHMHSFSVSLHTLSYMQTRTHTCIRTHAYVHADTDTSAHIHVYLSIFQIDTCIHTYTIHTYVYIHTYTYMIHAYTIHMHTYIYVCSHTSLMPHVARAAVRCMHACAIYHWARQGPAHVREESCLLILHTRLCMI